ncbi:hypothetical protein [Paracoccus xiamenensis]|uniref:hypothetical protein n=1 Tax=Paracoccus xiamenensis TaxID=2714901 RepID=UPI001407EBDC|nr:hypothetical protein [Paracoccus xiamenensis]NHF74318.1 hypothetical protein [Paracoccus xiamenensis]
MKPTRHPAGMNSAATRLGRTAAAAALALLAFGGQGALAAEYLALSFGAYRSSPVLLTHFAIESPLAATPEMVVSGSAESAMPRAPGSSAISLPRDVGGDGKWQVRAQWIELQTNRAYQAELPVPVSALTEVYRAYELNVIFGPNGLMILGSDKAGNRASDRVDLVAGCGDRVPAADRAWGNETGRFTELPQVRAHMRPVPARTVCPAPQR